MLSIVENILGKDICTNRWKDCLLIFMPCFVFLSPHGPSFVVGKTESKGLRKISADTQK